MVIWVLLSAAFACPMTELPPGLEYFSPNFRETGVVEAYGSFLSQDFTYSITVSEHSFLRLSIEPVNHNIKVNLVSPNSSSSKSSSSGKELKLAKSLTPGSYSLELVTQNIPQTSTDNTLACSKSFILLSFSILPVSKLAEYRSLTENHEFPDSDLAQSSLNITMPFSLTYPPFSIPLSDLTKANLFSYPLHVPEIEEEMKGFGFTGLWKLTFSLHHNFAVGGSLGALLNKGDKAISKKKCSDGQCVFAKRGDKNSLTLGTVLTEGRFVVSVYSELSEDEIEVLKEVKAVDVSLHITVEPLTLKEDRFNCEAGRLPDSLDFLIDSEGFLIYSEWVYAELGKKQITKFHISSQSVLRVVTTEPSGVDVDISLYFNEALLSRSNAIGGSEGILHEINPGDYSIKISFENSFLEDTRLKFCETVLIEIGISTKEAVEGLYKFYEIEKCEDSSEKIKKWFDGTTKITDGKYQMPIGDYFKMPVKSLVQSETEVLNVEFSIPRTVLSYFEIFSDFVTAGVTIGLFQLRDGEEGIIKGTDDALELGEHNRKAFAAVLKPGNYLLKVLSSATTKMMSNDMDQFIEFYKDSDYKVLKKCVIFQLMVQFIPTTDNKIENWECRETQFRLLPKTLNTLDRLGVKNTPVGVMPISSYFSTTVLAPNTYNNVTDSTVFYVESESVIRVFAESQDSPMILTLSTGEYIVSETKTQDPHFYLLNTQIEQHVTYKLSVSYFPANKKCQFYTILIQIIPKSRLNPEESCKELSLDPTFVKERFLDIDGIFAFLLNDGFSSVALEPEVAYKQSKVPYKAEIDLNVTAESAMVTGHLTLNFAKSGLILQIFQEEELIEWGSYKSPYRYELDPIPLTTGSYKIVITELAASPVLTCAKYSGSVLLEDLFFWNDVSSMVKKTETCHFPDFPETLNVKGMFLNGQLEWHQTLQMDPYLGQSFLDFTIETESVYMVSVDPVQSIDFHLKIHRFLETEMLNEGENSLTGQLQAGSYLIEVLYESEFGLPNPSLCPSFHLNLVIVPNSEYETRKSKYSCTKTQDLPLALENNSQKSVQIFGQVDQVVKVSVQESSEINLFAKYDFLLSGHVNVELLDKRKKTLKLSKSNLYFSQISMAVLPGDYFFRVYSDKVFSLSCWELALSYTHKPSEACMGGILPESLSSDQSLPYGGPQSSDGSISFSGTFMFDREKPEQVLEFIGVGESIVRILIVSRGRFRTESAVYETNLFNSPIGYSKNKSKYSSYVFQIFAQDTPYYLLINHIIEENKGCMLYDLKIAIEPVSSVSNILKCKVTDHEKPLPLLSFDLAKELLYEGENFLIFDKWMIGDKLPDGVVSEGKKNSKFLFEATLKVTKPGMIDAEVVYDYLTNDLNIEIWDEERIIFGSVWDNILDDQPEKPIISSVIEGKKLETGNYKLIISQGLVSNHLIQKFPGQTSCFPFKFYLEFTPVSSNIFNKLMSVNPNEQLSHNTLLNLVIILKFTKPVSEKSSVFLLKSSESSLTPSEVYTDEDSSSRVWVKFLGKDLKPGTCYDLIIEGESFELDGLNHKYCMSGCKCNPESQATCVDNACVCPLPYSGDDCFECVSGYQAEKSTCISTIDENPRVVSVKINTDEPVKRNQQLRVYVNFSSAPYTLEGEKVTRSNSKPLIDSFYLASSEKIVKAFTAMSLVKGDNRWVLRFASGDLGYGTSYTLEQVGGLLYTSMGVAFSFNDLQELTVEVSSKREDENECSGHGTEENRACVCEKGYKGLNCDLCEKGYYRTFSGTCEEQGEDLELDSGAYLKSVFPDKLTSVISPDDITVTLELSQKAFNDEGLVIDELSNTDVIIQAFVLQKGLSESFLAAKSVRSLNKTGLKWELVFDTTEIEMSKTYKLVQLDRALFTHQKKSFARPFVEMPRFRVVQKIECNHGRQDGSICVCSAGYSGDACEDCQVNFYKTLQGECRESSVKLTEVKEEISFSLTIFYCFCYFGIGMLVVYIISQLRKRQYSEYEVVSRRDTETGIEIDLYK